MIDTYKFSTLEYKRPDLEARRAKLAEWKNAAVHAESYAALRDLNAIIRDDMMKKEYLTITVGAPPQGRFVAWLQHSEKNNKVRIHARESEGYKQIITEVTVIRQAGPFALCRIGLITGRTHQIRVQFSSRGLPLMGDIRYGSKADCSP